MLTFAGQPAISLVQKFEHALLQPFDDTFGLVPNAGYKRMLAFGVPCMRDSKGNLPTSEVLARELANNVALRGIPVIDDPTWAQSAREDKTAETSFFSFIILDNANKAGAISKASNCIFGKRVCIKAALPTTPFKQCQRCHLLTHFTAQCNRPADYKRCGICGEEGHTAGNHQSAHCGGKHSTITCSCPRTC